MTDHVEIDDTLYSRQRYVLGDGAMQRMAKASVLLYGVGGIGIEIGKNLVLAGIKSLTVQDPNVASTLDLGTQFFLREDDVAHKKNRAEASVHRLSELNPYVSVHARTTSLELTTDLQYLKQFQCVIITELELNIQLKVNAFCRSHNIQYISADVYGLFAGAFCDFGDSFEVVDPDGEEPKEVFVATITKANPGVVTCFDNKMHGLESDNIVTFREVQGMSKLNGMQCKVQALTPYAFSICDTSGEEFAPHEHGGIVTQVKTGKTCTFQSLEAQLGKPGILIADFSKFEVPISTHAGFIALHRYKEIHRGLPNIWDSGDAEKLLTIVSELKSEGMFSESGDISDDAVRLLSYTCRGSFLPLCAAMGGIVAQEALKAITGKFTPLHQWLYLDAIDVLKKEDMEKTELFQTRGDRYDQLRICVGDNAIQKLQHLKLFMMFDAFVERIVQKIGLIPTVGCGAIGCEMLKNYAMLGVGSSEQGQITITDNDLIEKSNLNRQFLFRPQHIRQPKSTTAAQAALDINKGLHIVAQQHKVCVQTETTVYPDSFFEGQDLIVNALDNVEARRYVDMRCVTAQRSLLESGTMATKGHTQVIVANITESYGSQRDPVDEEVPYCTLKSFPANIEHCIQWARDKFESSFTQKPNAFNKFWSENPDTSAVIQCLSQSNALEGAVQASKLLHVRPSDWQTCIQIGRLKFEKYFNNKAKHLLNAFPLDTRISDGSLFWQSPKRPPTPQEFDMNNPLHLQFVIATAQLYAANNKIPVPEPIDYQQIQQVLATVKVPDYVPSNKRIQTDENKAENQEEAISSDELEMAAHKIQSVLAKTDPAKALSQMAPASFEKDDDSNGHIDFISAAANLRASMYQIEIADRLHIKRIAGRIVPAIATTTAAVSGLITIELVKVVQGQPVDKYRNCFLNLALPVFLLSEPGPAERTVIKVGLSYTNWDRWEVKGHANFTLQNLLDILKERVGSTVTFVGHGTKIVYTTFMPVHRKRLPEKMSKLLKAKTGDKYEDLVISFESIDGEDIAGPPVRYFFGL